MKDKRNGIADTFNYNVLIVESDPKEFELYSELIQSLAPCNIDCVNRIPDVSEWINQSNYHLVIISDSPLGIRSLEQIKRTNPSTSVILLSKEASIEEAVSAIRLGAEDYLAKPFHVDSFQLAVKRGLDRKMVFGENSGASHFLHLLNTCQLISAALDQKKVFETIQSYLTHELSTGYGSIYSIINNEAVHLNESDSMELPDKTLQQVLDIALKTSSALAAFSNSSDTYRFIEHSPLVPGLFLFRFRWGGQLEYYYACLSPKRPLPLDEFENRLRLLKAQIEVTGRNIEQYLGVQKLVYVDDATGLFNTRYLNHILDREIAQSQSSRNSFAVLFIDADRFKSINDEHGHFVGTKLLNELGNHLKKTVRETDSIFRYGGDEFVAILSKCDLDTARSIAETIRESVEKRAFLCHENLNIHFTVSIGVALFPVHAKSKKTIIEAADHAMYTAKRATRNTVSIAELNPSQSGATNG